MLTWTSILTVLQAEGGVVETLGVAMPSNAVVAPPQKKEPPTVAFDRGTGRVANRGSLELAK